MTPATMTKAEPSKAARPSSTKISVQFVYAPGLKRDGLPERPPHRELGRRRPLFRRLVHDPDGGIHRRGRLPLLPGRGRARRVASRLDVPLGRDRRRPGGEGQVGDHHRGPRPDLVRPVAHLHAPTAATAMPSSRSDTT